MVRRSILGLVATGAVLLGAGAAGVAASWCLVVGALLLTVGSVATAVALEARELEPWSPEQVARRVDLPRLDPAA